MKHFVTLCSPVICQDSVQGSPDLIDGGVGVHPDGDPVPDGQLADLCVVAPRAAEHPHHGHAVPDRLEDTVASKVVDEELWCRTKSIV